MSVFFRPYEGRKPFVFISYSHRDSARVLDIISPLHAQKYRVWYDEGIPAGCDWPKNIAQHMRAASAVLFFISETSISSINCLNEIREAAQQKKAILCMRLDASALPAEWDSLIGQAPTLQAGDEPAEALAQAVLAQGVVGEAFLGDGTNDPLLGANASSSTAGFSRLLQACSSCLPPRLAHTGSRTTGLTNICRSRSRAPR